MKKLLVILALSFSTNAFAGILLEPYVGYNTGTATQSGSADSDITAMGYGARLGFTLPVFFAAADFSSGSGKIKTAGSPDEDIDMTNLGLVVGASLPVIRLWAGYIFSAKADVESSGTTNKIEGDGTKVGLGFKLPALPISFNAEYIMTTFDEANGVAMTPELKSKVIFVSVSAPFNL